MTTPQAATLLLTPEEAADQLRIARSRIFDLIREGRLRSKKIGTSRRISYQALLDYWDSLPDDPGPA